MKRTSLLRLFLIFFAFTFALQPSSVALAHDDELPHIALNVSQAPPGATIEVVGEHFEPGVRITFALVQNGTQVQLGALSVGDQGEFTAPLSLPLDLQPGQYEFHAIDAENPHAIAPLTIVLDDNGQQDNSVREDSDSLLAPMPTFASGVVPSAVKETTPSMAASENNPFRLRSSMVIIVLFALSFGAGLFIYQKRKGA